MAKARLKDDEVFIDNLDVKRASRKMRKLPDFAHLHPNQALDLISQILGFAGYHDLRVQAADNVAVPLGRQPFEILMEESLHKGAPFPKTLPPQFDRDRCEKMLSLFSDALRMRTLGQTEVIALVGGAGTGKTILALRMVKVLGGAVRDAALYSQSIPESFAVPGALLVYDRPSVLPQHPVGLDGRMADYTDIRVVRQSNRASYRPFGMHGIYQIVLDSVRKHPETHFAVTFPSEDEVMDFLSSTVGPRDGKLEPLWKAALIVNLDTMTVCKMGPLSIAAYDAKRKAHDNQVHSVQ